MSKHNVLKLSCECGAQIIFEEILSGDEWEEATHHRNAFLEAHEVCRTKANSSQVVKKLLAGDTP